MSPRAKLALAALAALGLTLAACDRAAPPAPPQGAPACSCGAEPVVDPTLLAFLSKARAAHHQADLAIDARDPRAAVAALERVVAGPLPGGGAALPEVAEVIADTRARLAELRSEMGEFGVARSDVDKGLELAQRPTHFRGRLFEVMGVVLERQAKKLAEGGDAEGAKRARASALEAFETAIKIQDQVIAAALVDAGAPR